MKVLIVDDSRAMRMIVARTLRQTNLKVDIVGEAENGALALDLISQTHPDVIFCDWNMPVMNGLELLVKLRSEGKKMPFGFVTSESTVEMKQAAMDAGADFLIVKPFTADNFTDVLKKLALT